VAWTLIGAIAGFVGPIIAGTGRGRMRSTIPLGAVAAVVAGLAVYGVNSLSDDSGSDSGFFGASGSILTVTMIIVLVMLERRRDQTQIS